MKRLMAAWSCNGLKEVVVEIWRVLVGGCGGGQAHAIISQIVLAASCLLTPTKLAVLGLYLWFYLWQDNVLFLKPFFIKDE